MMRTSACEKCYLGVGWLQKFSVIFFVDFTCIVHIRNKIVHKTNEKVS